MIFVDTIEKFREVAEGHYLKEKGYSTEILDDYKWLQTELNKLIENNVKYSIFTILDGDGQDLYLVNGIRYVNRLGYVVLIDIEVKICEEGLNY